MTPECTWDVSVVPRGYESRCLGRMSRCWVSCVWRLVWQVRLVCPWNFHICIAKLLPLCWFVVISVFKLNLRKIMGKRKALKWKHFVVSIFLPKQVSSVSLPLPLAPSSPNHPSLLQRRQIISFCDPVINNVSSYSLKGLQCCFHPVLCPVFSFLFNAHDFYHHSCDNNAFIGLMLAYHSLKISYFKLFLATFCVFFTA